MTTREKHARFLDLPAGGIEPKASATAPSALERWLIRKLLGLMGRPGVRFVLWDESPVAACDIESTVAGLHIPNRRALWRLLINPGLHFGDDYSAGVLTVDGDLRTFLEAVYRAVAASDPSRVLARYAVNRPTWRRRNSRRGSRHNIHHHYDLGNEFYKLWLDKEMAYTCAYFPRPQATLEAAQLAKMELVCRKLRLHPGEEVIEAGCGWGALALYMAREYGVRVRAYNISREQLAHARARARAEGLDGRVQFLEDDYRNIDGRCDAFVSVGMLEHVGRANLAAFGALIDRCLRPSGRGLIHTISQNQPRAVNPWLERRIFPGGYPPTLREIAAILEPRGCVVTDVENLRPHYARTLEHWSARVDDHAATITAMYDSAFLRAWRLYLIASIANFATNALQLYQVTFTRAACTDTPCTREYLYGRGLGGADQSRSTDERVKPQSTLE